MADKKADFLELFQRSPRRDSAQPHPGIDTPPQGEEGECPAFGYLRGLDARALAVEFRFLDGNSDWYSYSLLSNWRHNPSVGLLLKFTSDVTTLVLIRGSNLDALVDDKAVNLTDRGFQRHRILWVREMDEGELRPVGELGPTIDRIEVADFESNEETQEWVKKNAPAFVRKM
jgi:hypothetical protein